MLVLCVMDTGSSRASSRVSSSDRHQCLKDTEIEQTGEGKEAGRKVRGWQGPHGGELCTLFSLTIRPIYSEKVLSKSC